VGFRQRVEVGFEAGVDLLIHRGDHAEAAITMVHELQLRTSRLRVIILRFFSVRVQPGEQVPSGPRDLFRSGYPGEVDQDLLSVPHLLLRHGGRDLRQRADDRVDLRATHRTLGRGLSGQRGDGGYILTGERRRRIQRQHPLRPSPRISRGQPQIFLDQPGQRVMPGDSAQSTSVDFRIHLVLLRQ
jgi:hypothetical protein